MNTQLEFTKENDPIIKYNNLPKDTPPELLEVFENRGLGHEFLRHIERTKLLIFVLDASGIDNRNPSDDYRILRSELEAYNPELLNRPYLIALNKIDTEESVEHIKQFKKTHKFPKDLLHEISAAYGEGLPELLQDMIKKLALGDEKPQEY